jgi:hypothetical protein
MPPRSFVLHLVALLSACSARTTASQDSGPTDDRLFVPPDLPNTNLNGHDEGLVLTAFTLARTDAGPELYAAVRNDGDTPACEAGMVTDFYDKSGARVTSAGSKLLSGRLYRLPDGTTISCVAPGQTAMTAATGLPEAVALDQLSSLVHLFPSFTVDVAPVVGLTLRDVRTVERGAKTAYTGTLASGLDQAVSAAKVTVFPVSRVGRPLGVATSGADHDLAAGATWGFETGTVDDPGVGYAAFATATLAQ